MPAGYASHTGYQYDSISRVAGQRELAPPSKFSNEGGFKSNVFSGIGSTYSLPALDAGAGPGTRKFNRDKCLGLRVRCGDYLGPILNPAHGTEQRKPGLGELVPCFQHIDQVSAFANASPLLVFRQHRRATRGRAARLQ